MTREDIDNIISIICPNDEDFEKPIISPAYLKKELEALALEEEPRKITLEDVKGYCKPRCLTIIANELLYELTHPKIKALSQEPSGDVISRQDAIDAIWDGTNMDIYTREVKETLEDLPSVEQEPQTGHWIVVSDGYGDNAYICECSECKDTVWVYKDADRKWNYCPNCGARMVEPQETETWNGIHAQITAPKGTFERIFNDADDDNDI